PRTRRPLAPTRFPYTTLFRSMSKPVRKWEVLVGKYLGIVMSALLEIAVLGGILILCTWLRLPGDYQLRTSSIDEREVRQIWEMRDRKSTRLNSSHVAISYAVF